MDAPSNELYAYIANYDSEFEPLMVKVRSEEEAKVFISLLQHLIYMVVGFMGSWPPCSESSPYACGP